jgi:hypothetical protein
MIQFVSQGKLGWEEVMLGLRAALRAFAVTAASVILTAFVGPIALAEVNLPVPTVNQSAVAARGFFYVGGHFIGEPGKHIIQGQIYVEGSGAEGTATPLSTRAHSRRGANGDQLDGNTRWPRRLGRIFF